MTAPHQVSVRALVEHCLRGGDLDLESAGPSSTLDAIRAHQKLQASRPQGYLKEVSVARRFERSELSLEVSGRIDGVWERESGPLIEEIKTTRGELEARALEENPTHWGLPALSPRRDLIRDRFERTEGAGFDYAYVVPGMNRVLQAAGRVIRSETDRGAVLLIDERFRERRYRSLFPPEWTPRFVRGPEELRRELAEFWK